MADVAEMSERFRSAPLQIRVWLRLLFSETPSDTVLSAGFLRLLLYACSSKSATRNGRARRLPGKGTRIEARVHVSPSANPFRRHRLWGVFAHLPGRTVESAERHSRQGGQQL